MADSDGAWIMPLVAVALVGLAGMKLKNHFTGHLAGYTLECPPGKSTGPTNADCSQPWELGHKAVFGVERSTQTVVMKLGSAAPRRLQNCSVLTRKDWICDGAFQGSTLMADDGRLTEVSFGHPPTVYTGRLKWYLLKYLDLQP